MYCHLYYSIFLSYLHDTIFLSGIFSHSDSISSSHLHYRAHQKNCLCSPFPSPTLCPLSSLDQDSPSMQVNKVDLELVMYIVMWLVGSHLIFVTTITTAGCVNKCSQVSNFLMGTRKNCFYTQFSREFSHFQV